MADISRELQAIMAAVYGEEVRGSIHDAIDKINKASEVTLTIGEGEPTLSAYENSIYIDTTGMEVYKNISGAWVPQGSTKGVGIANIEKTASHGLIDTYTITMTEGDEYTFMVTNGLPGNKWYRGNIIRGKSIAPALFPASGIDYAFVGDGYMNMDEAAIYHCTHEGEPTEALWQYDFTITGQSTAAWSDIYNKPFETVGSTLSTDEGELNVRTPVPLAALADNLTSDDTQVYNDYLLLRTSGGSIDIEDGTAFITDIKGNCIRDGYIPYSITTSGDVTVRIDDETFRAYVAESGTITFTFTATDPEVPGAGYWDKDLTLYGITVLDIPEDGDTFTVDYYAGALGTIINATPTSFVSTGWNLYNPDTGYQWAPRYSEQYGYRVGGTYTSVEFAETVSGARTMLSPDTNGRFMIPSDGYIFVNGGNDTTFLYPYWSDWGTSYEGEFKPYSASVIDISTVMTTYFPNGLFRVNEVTDEINLDLQTAISRIERLENTTANMATARSSGRDYIYDANFIYLVRATPISNSIEVTNSYEASDHGLEYITGSTVPVYVTAFYGQNLKDKLRHDVLTKTAQELTKTEQAQVRNNIDINVLVVTGSAISSLPTTLTASKITDDMVVINSELSNPAAQTGDWTVTTGTGTLTISGSISGTTNIKLYLAHS